MLRKLWWLVLFIGKAKALIQCYNCSSTHRDWNHCGGDFVVSSTPLNSSQKNIINCTGDDSMCFVRSWTTRSRHAWIVQRGCYQLTAQDLLPRSLTVPTGAMNCKHVRYPDAEYKVCLCQSDWCNSASTAVPSLLQYFTKLCTYIVMNIRVFQRY